MQRVLIDAGPLVAYLRRADEFHDWAVQQFERFTEFATCDAVLAEACARLTYYRQDASQVIRLLTTRAIEVKFDSTASASRVVRLMEKYGDQPMDFADACLVVMMEDVEDSAVVTLDRTDFSVYRRFDRQLVPFIAPEP